MAASTTINPPTGHQTQAPKTSSIAVLELKRSLETNLGPLTTTFTPPNECSTLLLRTVIKTGGDYNQIYVGYGETCTVDDDGNASTFVPASCYPGDLADWFNDPNLEIADRSDPAAYSPALMCPVGYSTACRFTRDGGSPEPKSTSKTDQYDIWNALKDGETAIGCCPTSYQCRTNDYRLCESSVSYDVVVKAISYDSKCATSTMITSIDIDWKLQVGMDDWIADAPRMMLIHPNPDATDNPTFDEDKNSSKGENTGLSTDAKIAIGTLVPLVAILFAILLWSLRRRKRPRQCNDATPAVEPQGAALDKPELGSDVKTTELGTDSAGARTSEPNTAISGRISSVQYNMAELPGNQLTGNGYVGDDGLRDGRRWATEF